MKYSNEKKDLAAALRWFARLDMNEGIANHFSLAVSDDGQEFLMNPAGKYWSKIKSSDILELDARKDPKNIGPDVDETAWCIHGAIHRQVPSARCVMHLHPKYATALSTLKNPVLQPIDQNTMRFYNRVSIFSDFGGLGFEDESNKMASAIGNNRSMLLANHGILTVGQTIAEAFDELYYFEKACETYLTALSTNKELNIVSSEVAEKTAQEWENYPVNMGEQHLNEIKKILDKEDMSYRE